MVHTIYSRRRDELPEIIEEKLSPLTAGILLMADGAKTLQQIFNELRRKHSGGFGIQIGDQFLNKPGTTAHQVHPRLQDLDYFARRLLR